MNRTVIQILREVENAVGESFSSEINSVHIERFGGETALHIVSKWGDAEAIKILVCAGANINKTGEDLKTPLHYAAMLGQAEAVKCLVELGAVRSKDIYGNSQSELAVKYPEIKSYLLQNGF